MKVERIEEPKYRIELTRKEAILLRDAAGDMLCADFTFELFEGLKDILGDD